MPMAFNLDDYRDDFKSEAGFDAFVDAFENALKTDGVLFMASETILGCGMSRSTTKRMLANRIAEKIGVTNEIA